MPQAEEVILSEVSIQGQGLLEVRLIDGDLSV